MKTCPWCEGKKVVGRIVPSPDNGTVTIWGVAVPTMQMVDQPCGICQGTGMVSDERYAQLTVPRESVRHLLDEEE